MARHKHKKKTHPACSAPLPVQARNALNNHRYKDAVNLYKQAIKTDDNSELKKDLAKAYLGRARELGRKGMYEEAFAVLENAAHQDSTLPVTREFIQWSICCGREESAAREFFSIREQLSPTERERFESLFALAALAGNERLADLFPEGSKLKTDLPSARHAIIAYCDGDDPVLKATLSEISFRSPYRDLRLLLSALSNRTGPANTTAETLAKIHSDSLFKPAARIVELSLSDSIAPTEIIQQSDAGCEFITALHGIDPRNLDLAKKISAPTTSAKNLFQLLISNRLPHLLEPIEEIAYRVLPQHPTGCGVFQQKFRKLEMFEMYRINALALEKREDYETASRAWSLAAETLGELEDTPKSRLIRAAFLRRAATCAERGDFTVAAQFPDYLEDSLELDPDDIDTYHRLFKSYKDFEPKAYFSCVERAIKRFPEDSGVLMAAIELAIERDAFKKASKYAATLLKIDPINPRARAFLVNSHLAHAAKQIVKKKFHLAIKEIESAEQYEVAHRPNGLIPLHRGLYEYAQDHEALGEQEIDRACKLLGGYLSGYFRAALEIGKLNLAPRYRKKYLALLKREASNPPSKPALLSLVREIHQAGRKNPEDVTEIAPNLKKTWSFVPTLNLGWEETEAVLEALCTAGLYTPLVTLSRHACSRWTENPVLTFYMIVGRSKGVATNLSPLDCIQLEGAIDRAHEQKNIRVANRMFDYLESSQGFMDYLDTETPPPEFIEIFERIAQENPEILEKIEAMMDQEDVPRRKAPTRSKNSNKKPKQQDPRNVDLFDDQSF